MLNFIYQVHDVNSKGIFWTVTNGKYQIINEHALKNSQDIVLTLGTITSLANIAMEGIMMKEEPNPVSHDLKFSILVAKSSFIDLRDSFDEDGPSLPNVVVLLYMNSRLAK